MENCNIFHNENLKNPVLKGTLKLYVCFQNLFLPNEMSQFNIKQKFQMLINCNLDFTNSMLWDQHP